MCCLQCDVRCVIILLNWLFKYLFPVQWSGNSRLAFRQIKFFAQKCIVYHGTMLLSPYVLMALLPKRINFSSLDIVV